MYSTDERLDMHSAGARHTLFRRPRLQSCRGEGACRIPQLICCSCLSGAERQLRWRGYGREHSITSCKAISGCSGSDLSTGKAALVSAAIPNAKLQAALALSPVQVTQQADWQCAFSTYLALPSAEVQGPDRPRADPAGPSMYE